MSQLVVPPTRQLTILFHCFTLMATLSAPPTPPAFKQILLKQFPAEIQVPSTDDRIFQLEIKAKYVFLWEKKNYFSTLFIAFMWSCIGIQVSTDYLIHVALIGLVMLEFKDFQIESLGAVLLVLPWLLTLLAISRATAKHFLLKLLLNWNYFEAMVTWPSMADTLEAAADAFRCSDILWNSPRLVHESSDGIESITWRKRQQMGLNVSKQERNDQ